MVVFFKKKIWLLCMLLAVCSACEEDVFKAEYSAAISIKDKYVQMKIYGKYNAVKHWDKVTVEILDRIIALHSPKKVLIVVQNDGDDVEVSTRILEKVKLYLMKGGCNLEVRDERGV